MDSARAACPDIVASTVPRDTRFIGAIRFIGGTTMSLLLTSTPSNMVARAARLGAVLLILVMILATGEYAATPARAAFVPPVYTNLCVATDEQLAGQGRYALAGAAGMTIADSSQVFDNLVGPEWMANVYPSIAGSTLPAAMDTPVIILVVDDFSFDYRATGGGMSHGYQVEGVLIESLNVLDDSARNAVQIIGVDVTYKNPQGQTTGGTGYRLDAIAPALDDAIAALYAGGYSRFVINMSYSIIPCEDENTGFVYFDPVSTTDFISTWLASAKGSPDEPAGQGYPAWSVQEHLATNFFGGDSRAATRYLMELMTYDGYDGANALQDLLAGYESQEVPLVIPVASAGNYADWVVEIDPFTNRPFAPARWSETISVSAGLGQYTDIWGAGEPLMPTPGPLWEYSQPGEIIMPGAWYYFTSDDHLRAGTSFSAPFVSLTSALYLKHDDLSVCNLTFGGQGAPILRYPGDWSNRFFLAPVATERPFNCDLFSPYPLGESGTVDLTVVKSLDPMWDSHGEPFRYIITVTNTGTVPATRAKLIDLLPDDAPFDWIFDITRGFYNPATGTWWIGKLGEGESATLTLVTEAVDAWHAGTIVNTAHDVSLDQALMLGPSSMLYHIRVFGPLTKPDSLSATIVGPEQIDVTVSSPGPTDDEYEIQRLNETANGWAWQWVGEASGTGATFTDTLAVECGRVYAYRVRTHNQRLSGYPTYRTGWVYGASDPATCLYVDADAVGNNDGSSWFDAFTRLQDALAVSAAGQQIWVAEGVYYPDEGGGQTDNNRAATFQLRDGVAIYGGFAGTETLLSQRDPAAHVTILSGDIGQDDLNADGNFIAEDTGDLVGSNSYHVVTGSGTDSSALLDGFTITAGQANATAPNDSGGGLYNSGGGGMYNYSSSPTLTDVTFSGNSVSNGGGMYNVNNSSPTLTGVTFSGNSATVYGGGMYNSGGSPTLTNVILWGNTAGSSGPQIFNSSSTPVISHSLIEGSGGSASWDVSLGTNGGYNLDADPQFVDADGADNVPGTLDDNLRLQGCSPAIDAGDTAALPPDTLDLDGDGNTAEPIPYDLDGNPRLDGLVDMGAYERVGGGYCLPAAPTNLEVTPLGQWQIDLTWTDNATNETGYVVQRSTDGGATWSPLASLPVDAQSHADTGLTCGTTYHYRVYATNADGNSGYSNVASATTDACPPILYVDADAVGNNDGSSWFDAFTRLQDALAVSAAGQQIWVAEGVYYPDEGGGQTDNNRAATFQLRDGVAIYGGFAGTETLLSQRDPAAHVTILSGDIGQDDLNADGNFIAEDTGDLVGSNSYHVVTGSGTDSSALLDGFTITAGQANATAPNDSGGGLYNSGGSPTLADITFSGNSVSITAQRAIRRHFDQDAADPPISEIVPNRR